MTDDIARPDPQARAAYRVRLGSLRDELEEAERFNDTGRTARLREEIEFLGNELCGQYGFGDASGRSRGIERIRKAVGNRLRDAITRIREAHPTLGDHLSAAIKTGVFCSYHPDPPVLWEP